MVRLAEKTKKMIWTTLSWLHIDLYTIFIKVKFFYKHEVRTITAICLQKLVQQKDHLFVPHWMQLTSSKYILGERGQLLSTLSSFLILFPFVNTDTNDSQIYTLLTLSLFLNIHAANIDSFFGIYCRFERHLKHKLRCRWFALLLFL